MLLLNRFHFDNKTLVLSSYRYPTMAFKALCEILENFPDIPIYLLHDASAEGVRMKERLQADPKWPLKGKNVHDLGIFPDEVREIKNPVWIPSGRRHASAGQAGMPTSVPAANIQQGFRMPVDVVPPTALLGVAGAGVLTGYSLLGNDMQEYRKQQGSSRDAFTAGFG
jgi:hypothetical protein